jgi:acyl-coenzyme A thioesterase PaaI-like protein
LPELVAELASPDAALHIGPQHVLLETAAIDLAAGLVGTDRLQMQSWHVMFLARGKAGPFRVDGEAVRGAGSRVGVRLSLHDEGQHDRMVTSASAVFEIVE